MLAIGCASSSCVNPICERILELQCNFGKNTVQIQSSWLLGVQMARKFITLSEQVMLVSVNAVKK